MEKKIPEEIEEQKSPWLTPIRIILGLFLLLILLISLIPISSYKIDPEPQDIPGLEIIPSLDSKEYAKPQNNLRSISTLVSPNDPYIKQIAGRIAAISCDGEKVCQAKAIFYFIRDKFDYISDPVNGEYIEDPKEYLATGGGDCESGTIALASLYASIGIRSEMVIIPGHAYLRIRLDEAKKKYQRDGWVYLDWTCSTCGFGEIPYSNHKKEERYVKLS